MRHALLVVILALVILPSTASAQSAADLQQEATASYLAGDYATAILKFTAAYDIDPDPIFQYNLSLCYGKLGNAERGLAAAMKAAEDASKLPEEIVPKNQGRLNGFYFSMAAAEAADEIRAAEQGSSTCESDSECEGGFYCAADGVCQEQTGKPVTQTRRLGAVGYVGIGLIVVGAGAATAALIVDAGLAPDLKRLDEDTSLTQSERDDLLEDVSRRQGQGRVLVFAGTGFAIVGAGLLVYDLLTVEEVPVAFTPVLGPDHVGATVRWKF